MTALCYFFFSFFFFLRTNTVTFLRSLIDQKKNKTKIKEKKTNISSKFNEKTEPSTPIYGDYLPSPPSLSPRVFFYVFFFPFALPFHAKIPTTMKTLWRLLLFLAQKRVSQSSIITRLTIKLNGTNRMLQKTERITHKVPYYKIDPPVKTF